MTRTLCLATVLASGIGLAGWPAQCAAQADHKRQGMSLGAAVEEARRSPFHAAATVAEPGEARMSRLGLDTAPEPQLYQPGPQVAHVDPRIPWLTYVTAGVSHLAATYLFWTCAMDEGFDSSVWSATQCLTAPIVPLVTVPAPAMLAGAGLGKSLGASAAGLGGGAAAYLVAMLITEQVGNADPIVAGIASGAVHAAVVNRMLR